MPAKGTPHVSYRDVRIVRDGRTWTATWHVTDGTLYVSSAWGSKSEPVGRTRDMAKRATALLTDMVDDYARR